MWHRSLSNTIKQAQERGLCLYGAGFWGEIAYRIFSKMGCKPICYCDDDSEKWNQTYQGIPVYSLEEVVKKYPNAVYIVCIDCTKKSGTWNRDNLSNMLGKLKKYGVYDSNSELRVPMYLFLLDIENLDDYSMNKSETGLIQTKDIQNLVIFNHMSNSGSFYLEQLLDGHPNILPYSVKLTIVSHPVFSAITPAGN